MIKKYRVLLAALSACLAEVACLHGEVGDPAPPLVVKEWINGKPAGPDVGTNVFNAGTNIYVVEIFHTANYPSHASITNLSKLQKRYRDKGVVVVGISDDPLEQVRQFVQQGGTNIQYSVGVDNERQTLFGYMSSVRQRGTPCAFVVGRDTTVLWQGDPRHGLGNVLEAVLAGTYDVKSARKAEVARIQMAQYLGLVQRRDARAGAAGRTLLAARANDVALLCDMAFEISSIPKLAPRELALANAALDQAEKLCPTNTTRAETTRAILLFETGQREEAIARARKAVAEAKVAQDKANAEICLRKMETRMHMAVTNRANLGPTNQVKAAMTNQTSQSATNQPQGSSEKH